MQNVSLFTRFSSSVAGMVVGLGMVVGSFPVLFLNEGRAVKTARSLEEGAAAVVHVDNAPVQSANEGRLVHFNGPAETRSMLRDPVFGLQAKALQLVRKVEMYQWKQSSVSTTRDRAGGSAGGRETVTTYEYRGEWSDQLVSSRDFREPNGHQNPTALPYPSATQAANDVTVGDFQVPQRVVAGLRGGATPLTLDERALAAAPRGGFTPTGEPGRPRVDDGCLYYGGNPASPRVGDARVRFSALGLDDLSVIGRQVGRTIEPYRTRVGRDLEMGQIGTFSATAMFDDAIRSNTVLTWFVRVGGFLLMFFGSSTLLKPLSVAGSVVPILGSLIGLGTAVIAFAVSGVASLVVVAVAWIAYRPLVGIGLLVLGGAIAVSIVMTGRTRAVMGGGQPMPPPMPPPSPPPPVGGRQPPPMPQ